MKGMRVDDLAIEYRTAREPVRALDGVSIAVRPGEVLALVGESGSGNSTLAMAVGRLLHRSARIIAGAITVDGHPAGEMAVEETVG